MYISLLSTDEHTHANILRESVLSLGAAKSCQETLYPSLSLGPKHFTYDIWRKMVLQEGGWWHGYQTFVFFCVSMSICAQMLYLATHIDGCIKDWLFCTCINSKFTVFTECETKTHGKVGHVWHCKVLGRVMRVPHSDLTLPDLGGFLTWLGAERVTFVQNNQWLLCYGGVARWCHFRSAQSSEVTSAVLKTWCLGLAKCCASVKTIHLTKAFQLCKQSASKALQKFTWYNFMLLLAN